MGDDNKEELGQFGRVEIIDLAGKGQNRNVVVDKDSDMTVNATALLQDDHRTLKLVLGEE